MPSFDSRDAAEFSADLGTEPSYKGRVEPLLSVSDVWGPLGLGVKVHLFFPWGHFVLLGYL